MNVRNQMNFATALLAAAMLFSHSGAHAAPSAALANGYIPSGHTGAGYVLGRGLTSASGKPVKVMVYRKQSSSNDKLARADFARATDDAPQLADTGLDWD